MNSIQVLSSLAVKKEILKEEKNCSKVVPELF